MSDHKARKWVEETYPELEPGAWKAALILAYGAGLDAGLAEAQEIIQQAIERAS